MNARHIPMTADQYHATKDLGSSMIETFRDSRTLFHGLYVTGEIPRKPPSPAMELGTLVHLRILEPDQFKQKIAPDLPPTAPDGSDWNLRKPDHRDWKATWIESNCTGKIFVDAESRAKIEAMAASVFANRRARHLIERRGEPEYSVFWTDNETGLDLKCRVDWMGEYPIDLKTTRDCSPEAFAKQCVELGYARKKAHYEAGINELLDLKEPMPLIHIAVSSEAPFNCACYTINDRDKRSISLGKTQWRECLTQIAHCQESGNWRDPYTVDVIDLSLPHSAFSQDQYTFTE